MPSITPMSDPLVVYNVGQSILDSLAQFISERGIQPPPRRWVGFSNPPEDCCPDLVIWADNLRLWDGASFDSGLRENRLMCNNLWAVDYTVRLGLCYFDVDNDGQLVDSGTLTGWAADLYHIGHAVMGWLQNIRGGVIPELQSNVSDVKPSPITSYNMGGCAGWQITLTVGLE
jgi:hypothetical protein